MLTPSIFGENLFDDWFDDFPFFDDRDLRKVDKKLYGRRAGNLMKTDMATRWKLIFRASRRMRLP